MVKGAGWTARLSTPADERLYGLAALPDGGVLAAGYTKGDLDGRHAGNATDDASWPGSTRAARSPGSPSSASGARRPPVRPGRRPRWRRVRHGLHQGRTSRGPEPRRQGRRPGAPDPRRTARLDPAARRERRGQGVRRGGGPLGRPRRRQHHRGLRGRGLARRTGRLGGRLRP
ncbi:hypothetical protein [Nonomuraea dietziae]|uniref:hypothetical protein n=1 Tax=Nonomuraea dietziae TaxID=65515 RepID=UPI0031CDBA94